MEGGMNGEEEEEGWREGGEGRERGRESNVFSVLFPHTMVIVTMEEKYLGFLPAYPVNMPAYPVNMPAYPVNIINFSKPL